MPQAIGSSPTPLQKESETRNAEPVQLYCDNPHESVPFLDAGVEWQPLESDDIPDEVRKTLRLLAPSRSLWTASSQRQIDGHLLIVDKAEQSQFLRLQEHCQKAGGLPDAFACIALEGRGFVGQRGRAWSALRGNLHLTTYRRLALPAQAAQTALVALPAVATVTALDHLMGNDQKVGIKWVNDVLIGDRKVGGVLTATQVQEQQIRHVLFGVGVNVARAPNLEPLPWVTPPTSLADVDAAPSQALPHLLFALIGLLWQGIADIELGRAAEWVNRYRARCMMIGREVRIDPEEISEVDRGHPLALGRVLALTDDLGLVMEGISEPVRRGRLTLLP